MANIEKLVEKIRSKGMKIGFVADVAGVSRQAFIREHEFKVGQAERIRTILELSDDEYKDIFLS